MELFPKQVEGWDICENDQYRNILFDGGARSGKTILFILRIILRAQRISNSRHLIARLRFSHAKNSIWRETLLPKLREMSRTGWRENKQDWVIEFTNGSEIWLGGFDERERTEKILGHEYNTIFFNEVSQISYDIIEMALPRLAKNNPGLVNKAFYDCNPPSPLHWVHKIFYEGVEPRDLKPLKFPEMYAVLKMNPMDNPYLPKDYIETQLDTRSKRYQQRFKYGEYVKAEGTIYDEFDESYIIKEEDLPAMEKYSVGVDFSLNMAAVLIGWCGDSVYIIDDMQAYNTTASQFNTRMQQEWGDKQFISWCDPSGAERLQEITNSAKANNSVDPGIDAINTKIHNKRFWVCDKAVGTLSEIWDYKRLENEKVDKINDHCMDAMRYGIFSEIATPLQIFL